MTDACLVLHLASVHSLAQVTNLRIVQNMLLTVRVAVSQELKIRLRQVLSYLLTKNTHDRKPVCLVDVRRIGRSAIISKEFSSSSLKNKDPKQFFIKLFMVPLHVSNYCSKAPSKYNIMIAKITVLHIMA